MGRAWRLCCRIGSEPLFTPRAQREEHRGRRVEFQDTLMVRTWGPAVLDPYERSRAGQEIGVPGGT
jgi:hypothetical protein